MSDKDRLPLALHRDNPTLIGVCDLVTSAHLRTRAAAHHTLSYPLLAHLL